VGRSIAAASNGGGVRHSSTAAVGMGGDRIEGGKERTTDRHSSILY
jgi:hypothetical protein